MRRPACPTIIDIEASGFGSHSYPIEVGVVNYDGERYCALIKPEPDWQHWCDKAERVHGISRKLLASHGKSAREVCQELNDFLQESMAFSDAWIHDNPWLTRLFFAARMNRSFHLSPIEYIASEPQLMLWDKTKIRLQQELGIERHRASGDAYLIQQTYIETVRLIEQKPAPKTPATDSQSK